MGSSTWTTRTREGGDGKLHLSCADTAKLVRKALKEKFPGQKFSVRSDNYSMGASITVTWTDGPLTSEVEKVAKLYEGAAFDGMIDLKTHVQHWLEPDGTTVIAHAPGTTGSLVEVLGDPPSPNARLVRFGADYVICQRSTSEAFRETLVERFEQIYGEFDPNRWYDERRVEGIPTMHVTGKETGSTLLYRIACYTPGPVG